MYVQLRLPDITGSEKEQLAKIRSYLYQIVPELEYALNTIDTSISQVSQPTPKSQLVTNNLSEANAQVTFNAIKPLIIRSADILKANYDNMLHNEDTPWSELTISENVSEASLDVGRLGKGVGYKVSLMKHIYVAFNVSFTASKNAIRVDTEGIPTELCPSCDVYAICAVGFADGGQGIAKIGVTSLGEINIYSVTRLESVFPEEEPEGGEEGGTEGGEEGGTEGGTDEEITPQTTDETEGETGDGTEGGEGGEGDTEGGEGGEGDTEGGEGEEPPAAELVAWIDGYIDFWT